MTRLNSDTFWNAGMQWISDSNDYIIDRTQRSVLFWDVLRKRGNNYLAHLESGQPPILIFDYEIVLDGRIFDKPVNYSLVRILDRRKEEKSGFRQTEEKRRQTQHGKPLDSKGLPLRPIVVIDPRAGHGPGIGGSKLNSQIGVALDHGHPVYFIVFYTEPEPGQTISRVHNAEVRFLEEVAARHSNAPKPAVIGNCQAGWATALIGADHPEVTGPMIFNGSPLSYWGGVEGTNPMRYKGGLTGGIWLTSLWSDLGNNKFDGANLVAGFEDLNPANTYWSKYYHLFANVDTEEKRFLDFEKWWGGFFKMNAEEIHFIVSSLFIGNELEKGHLQLDDGRFIDLKNFKDPIIAFASEGDNITPPSQALNWIAKVYGSVDEIKDCGQVIIYMVHKKIGHLGIFVSGSVAKKEHNQILGNMGWLEYLAPGLYEMVIEEASNTSGLDDYSVRFEDRTMEDLLYLDDGIKDEEPFVSVHQISKLNDTLYRALFSPFLKTVITEPVAEVLRQLHPLRASRYMISDSNPFCWPLKLIAEQVPSQRKIVAENNPLVQLEQFFSDSMKNSLNCFRDFRDLSQEYFFKTTYDNPWMKTFFGETTPLSEDKTVTEEEEKEKADRKKIQVSKRAEKGGFVEATVRIMLATARANMSLNTLEFQVAEDIIQKDTQLRKLTPEQYKQIAKEQAAILHAVPRKALTSLALMELTDKEKKKLIDIAQQVSRGDGCLGKKEEGLLKTLHRILLEKGK
ncbi:MAG: DUF3141 domain-containing protein [Desulfobulbaceae bacterium]|nr:DUF3141 domain-containing protein [Desulfobulbaceae bacterium]